VTTRADLSWQVPLDGGTPAKTFVLEVHTESADDYLQEIAVDCLVEPTEDAYLSRVQTPAGDFWVDRLISRFWTFHTVMPSAPAADWLKNLVESRRDTDWMWLPSAHLRNVAPSARPRKVRTEFTGTRLVSADDAAQDLKVQLTGSHAERLLDEIADLPQYRSAVSFNTIEVDLYDSELGALSENVRRWGAFAARGDDFTRHAQFVRTVVGRYADLIESVEALAIDFRPIQNTARPITDDESSGATYTGSPIGIQFSRQIPDLPAFCDELFSSRAPFRLWGRTNIVDDSALVDVVDLHVGQRLTMEVGRDWMRVYMRAGSCGNTVARLVSPDHSQGLLAVAECLPGSRRQGGF
jgi:hypothetical protein